MTHIPRKASLQKCLLPLRVALNHLGGFQVPAMPTPGDLTSPLASMGTSVYKRAYECPLPFQGRLGGLWFFYVAKGDTDTCFLLLPFRYWDFRHVPTCSA